MGTLILGLVVHVISYKAIRSFTAERPDSTAPLDNWYRVASGARWESLSEIRKTFASADWVAPYVVFNIAGNKYRLIAEVNFPSQTLFIRHILTHTEYDKGKWKQL